MPPKVAAIITEQAQLLTGTPTQQHTSCKTQWAGMTAETMYGTPYRNLEVFRTEAGVVVWDSVILLPELEDQLAQQVRVYWAYMLGRC